jgi:hypothetical protein
VALSVWSDEAKGLVHGLPVNDEGLGMDSDDKHNELFGPGPNPGPSSNSRTSTPPLTAPLVSASGEPTPGSKGDDDWNLDDLIREEEQSSAVAASKAAGPSSSNELDDLEFWAQLAGGEEGSIRNSNLSQPEAGQATTSSKPVPAGASIVDEDSLMDEDAWDAMDAMEQAGTAGDKPLGDTAAREGNLPLEEEIAQLPAPSMQKPLTEEEEWESMYE